MTAAKQYTANGLTMTLPEWAKHLNVLKVTLYQRIHNGMAPQEALTSKSFAKSRMITAHGLTMNIQDWGKRNGLSWNAIATRLANGESPTTAVSRPAQRGQGTAKRIEIAEAKWKLEKRIVELARRLNIPSGLIKARIRNGETLAEAIKPRRRMAGGRVSTSQITKAPAVGVSHNSEHEQDFSV